DGKRFSPWPGPALAAGICFRPDPWLRFCFSPARVGRWDRLGGGRPAAAVVQPGCRIGATDPSGDRAAARLEIAAAGVVHPALCACLFGVDRAGRRLLARTTSPAPFPALKSPPSGY